MSRYIYLIRDLESVRENLSSLLTDTEKDFLNIGEQLTNFTTRSSQVLDNTKATTDIISGDNMKALIEKLKEILDRINRYLNFNSTQLDDNLGLFDHMVQIIQSSMSPIKNLEKSVLELRMLGISTRIESAHLTSENSSFDTLSINVNDLAEQIKTKSGMIGHGLADAQDLVKSAHNQIKEFETQQQEYAQSIFSNINTCIISLDNKHGQSIDLVNSVMDENNTITNGVHGIVGSLQVHDITRQKLEHVDAAVQEMIDSLYKIGDDQSIEMLAKVADICNLQIQQLTLAREDILRAFESLIENGNSIVHNSEHMISQTRALMENSDQQANTFCLRIESGIGSVVSSLRSNASIIYEMSETTNSIAGIVEQMTRFIKDIKEIGTNISLIAFNAIINAEHLHREGASLSVLAEGIQGLAASTRNEIDNVADNLSKITDFAEKLSHSRENDTQEKEMQTVVDDMAQNLNVILAELNNIFSKVSGYLSSIESEGKLFQNDLKEALSKIQVHHVFDDMIAKSQNILINVMNEMKSIIPEDYYKNRKDNLDLLKTNYSMHSERLVHNAFLEDKEVSVNTKATGPEDDLGDNVELF